MLEIWDDADSSYISNLTTSSHSYYSIYATTSLIQVVLPRYEQLLPKIKAERLMGLNDNTKINL
ncbi:MULTISPECIES: hypothetical protein [unclassified Arcicella]|uniref:hypothetical protein n=1 Tax=unclassified Arcicella TaxID=2644986 RepID=UPI00285CBA74|nr:MULTISPECIES: hypothetical protein [unclassified Arcicella]MDR6562222.1 hypothetical protein [Arcicella sp. BE51]MDR6812084.1 hypothetical protein [Arcicella sp. BE140]MDR6823395.1 hypothetical protein [Arcicella sp. BE139]